MNYNQYHFLTPGIFEIRIKVIFSDLLSEVMDSSFSESHHYMIGNNDDTYLCCTRVVPVNRGLLLYVTQDCVQVTL